MKIKGKFEKVLIKSTVVEGASFKVEGEAEIELSYLELDKQLREQGYRLEQIYWDNYKDYLESLKPKPTFSLCNSCKEECKATHGRITCPLFKPKPTCEHKCKWEYPEPKPERIVKLPYMTDLNEYYVRKIVDKTNEIINHLSKQDKEREE